ncbi:MAG: response regulator transcription factor [Planctomycetes bacterium]|jgi:DNA-binding response OmpR family regulator|nr:response regulator transcription factor [Planctomycetota bacterium]
MSRWILIAEDEGPLGEMLCDNLTLESYHAELVRNGPDALLRMQRGDIDLLVLDVMLPGCDGFEVLKQLRARGDNTPVMILSARSADRDRIRGLELLADDYLTKPFNLRELLLRVDALLRRSTAPSVGTDVLLFGGHQVDFRSMRLRCATGEDHQLTPTETRLLKILAAHEGTVVSRKILVERLFGSSAPLTVRTLDNIVLRLRKLIEREPAEPRHLHTVRGFGLRFDR